MAPRRNRLTTGFGWALVFEGIVLLALAAVFMWCADGDPWDTVGLVIGLIGGGFIGTGGSILFFPEDDGR